MKYCKLCLLRAWQYFRASGKIDGINAGAKRMVRLGNSHPNGPPGFVAAPPVDSLLAQLDGVNLFGYVAYYECECV